MRVRPIIPAILCALLALMATIARADIVYVSESAAGAETGASWQDAFTTVQAALDAASPGDEVWVTEGTYQENLTVPTLVALYGGFGGYEESLEERDPDAYVATLDGGGNGPVLVSEGSTLMRLDGFTIINGASPDDGGGARLLGFQGVIANVTFSGNTAPRFGGGLYLESNANDADTLITLENISFDDNSADTGGGLYFVSVDNTASVDILISNADFRFNTADTWGGGLYFDSALADGVTDENVRVAATLDSLNVESNSALWGGGAFINRSINTGPLAWASDTLISNSLFYGNTAVQGGGLYARCNMDVTSSYFEFNQATAADQDGAGGGVYVDNGNNLAISLSHLTGNSATGQDGNTGYGGGAAAANGGGIFVYYSRFHENSADHGAGAFAGDTGALYVDSSEFLTNAAANVGGAIFIQDTESYGVQNSLFAGNTAGQRGGALALDSSLVVSRGKYPSSVQNNTLAENTAPVGAGLSVTGESRAHFFNNIVAFNSSGVHVGAEATLVFHHNDVHGNAPGADFSGMPDPSGTLGNISADPLFADRTNGDFHLADASPARDAGDNADYRYWSNDLDGSRRVQGAAVDLGSYETPDTPPLYLEFSVSPDDRTGPGPLNPQPVVTVRNGNGALQTNYSGTVTLSLAPGYGTPSAALTGTVAVPVVNGVATFTDVGVDRGGAGYRLMASVQGRPGFWSTRFSVTQPRVYVRPTGDDANSGDSWANAKRSPRGAFDLAASGGEIWIAEGVYSTHLMLWDVSVYGGFAGTETSLSQRSPDAHVTVLENQGQKEVLNVQTISGSSLTIDGLHIRNGDSGIVVFAPNVTITRNLFSGNTGAFGGGVLTFGENVTIARNQFLDNRAAYGGGAVCIAGGSALVKNNLMAHNAAPQDGSAITFYNDAVATVAFNTIVENADTNGAIHAYSGTIMLANNIVAGNASGIVLSAGQAADVSLYSNLVYNNGAVNYLNILPGDTDISSDPKFAAAASGNWRLTAASPARDAGDGAFLQPGDLDLDGRPRLFGPRVDIGAYEWTVGGPTFTDVALALRAAAGLTSLAPADASRLDVVGGSSANRVDLLDALRIARDTAP